jgi:serine/threonine protein kinase
VTGSALAPGIIAAIQTFGDRIDLHPRLHFLVTEGGVDEAGVFLFEMLTGPPPFRGATPMSVALKHRDEPALDPGSVREGLPAEIRRIVLKCLEKDRDGNIENFDTFCLGLF